ncbi:protein PLASTID REDOX INSENSITIVE 2, chloroplastic isoform X3 [Syzygium oleosum]|uniref:protein PLASTID REDOX INSENSITIVE 2, chloroplastic isoform X3 n=1 Tax=Syzygium oleosum TaxID=219896 RepID=UPI0024B8ECA3|nr:protein PLASTID REDOX INSENSITIVE 2, chloroplastic isoform X3 [Syzygium oleosum]
MALQAPLLFLSSPPPLPPSTCDPEMSSHGVPSRFQVKPILSRRPRNSPSWETRKFEGELREKLSGDVDTIGEDLDSVIRVRTQLSSEFLHEEYGGPGTLLVDPFTDMLVALKENNLTGATLAVRASMLWAQNFVDQDWEIWNTRRSS